MINTTVEKTYLPSKNSKTELLSLRTNYYRKKRVWTSLNRTFYNIPTQRVSIHQDVKTGRPIKQMKPLTANEGINNNCSSRLIMKEAGVSRNGRNFAKALLCRCCQRKCAPPDYNDTSPHSVLSSDEAGSRPAWCKFEHLWFVRTPLLSRCRVKGGMISYSFWWMMKTRLASDNVSSVPPEWETKAQTYHLLCTTEFYCLKSIFNKI